MDNTIPAPMPSSARKSLFRFWFVVLLIALAGVLIVVRCSRKGRPYRPPPIAYSGSSSGLKTTVIVPTLDTPLPKERNVIWCSSFGVAWNSLKIDVTKEPVRIRGAEEIAVRLNKVKDPEADLPSESYYAAAGFVSMDIVRTIQDAMARRFPSAPTPGFGSVAADGIIAYAYLAANVKFTIPFFDNRDEFLFKAPDGKTTAVSSFGIRQKDDYAYFRLRRQVSVLYATKDWFAEPKEETEFAVDPCKDSSPSQIILARIEPKETLEKTLASLDQKIASFATNETYYLQFGPNDVLLAPNIYYKVNHRFRELEGKGKTLLNKGFESYWVNEAQQMIEFKLDRSGAELKSEAKILFAPVPRYFVFDGPFLVCMRKRGAARPYFVMWVENAELLCK